MRRNEVDSSDHLLIFDGDCGFCSASAAFLQRHVRPRAGVIAYQRADVSVLGLTKAECSEAVRYVRPPSRTAAQQVLAGRDVPALAGPAAIGAVLQTSTMRTWRLAGRLLSLQPVLWLAWPVYRWIAKHRHQLPGGTPACAIPPRANEGG